LAAVLLLVGFHFFMVGVLADLVGFNRRLLGELLYRARRWDAERGRSDSVGKE
jgi:hypothetical protein